MNESIKIEQYRNLKDLLLHLDTKYIPNEIVCFNDEKGFHINLILKEKKK